MIALAARDQPGAPGLAALEMILPRELDRCLDRFRSAAGEPDPVERPGALRHDQVGQLFGGLAREEARMRVFERARLFGDRGRDRGVGVPERRHSSTATGVDVAPPVFADQVNPFAADRDGRP